MPSCGNYSSNYRTNETMTIDVPDWIPEPLPQYPDYQVRHSHNSVCRSTADGFRSLLACMQAAARRLVANIIISRR